MKVSLRALLVAAILALLPATAQAQKQPLVRLSFSGGWDALPAVVGIERGFFAQEGLVVSGLTVPTASAVINSLATGSTDFATVPQRVLLVLAAAKAPIKVLAVSGWGTEMELVAKKGVNATNLADLKGKRIAVLNGSDALPVLVRLLNQARMRPNDIQIMRLDANSLTQAFKNNTADAIFETRHFTSVFVDSGAGQTIMNHVEITKSLGLVGAKPLIASEKLLKNDPQIVEKFLRGWVKALLYIEQDPEDAGRILQIFLHRQGVRMPKDVAATWVKMTKYKLYEWSAAAIADAEYNGWGLNAGGILKVAPKLGAFVDNSYVRKAATAVGAQ